MEPISRLQAATALAAPVIAATTTDQYALPSPCAGWDVRALVNHMAGALTMFRDVARTGSVDPAIFEADLLGSDPAASFRAIADDVVAAWQERGLDGTAALPFGEFPAAFALQLPAMDMVVHTWDLATATGQQPAWDDDLVEVTRQFVEATFTSPEMRGEDFAAPVEVPADAAPIDRLAGFLGRRPVSLV